MNLDFLYYLPLTLWIIWMVYCIIHWLIPSIRDRENHEIAMAIATTLFFTTLLLNAYIEPLIPEVLILQYIGMGIMWFALFIFISQFFVMLRLGEGEKNWEDTTVLITSGWFKVMRHPMFFACILCNISLFFTKLTWLNFLLAPISVFLCIKSALWDEKVNIKKFGEEYLEYMKKVRMFGII